MSDFRTRSTDWEMTEHNWHGVASLNHQTLQWNAYVEAIDAPFFRTWAGQSFDSLVAAQNWCRAEIARQIGGRPPIVAQREIPPTPGPEAWKWLWARLRQELGPERLAALRTDLERQKV